MKLSKPEQLVAPVLFTEEELIRAVMRKIGSRGGSRNTEKQREARIRNVHKALKKRAEKYAK